MKLFPPHPRLLIDASGLNALRGRISSDPKTRRVYELICEIAESETAREVVRCEKTGRRLLDQSRTCLKRVLSWGLVGLLGNRPDLLERAKSELLAAAAFPDWNPAHFLDTAEMTLALAIGYDWLFDQLSPDQRQEIAAAIVAKGLMPSRELSEGRVLWWVTADNNWNQVCHAGVACGAIAVGDLFPDLAGETIERATANVPAAEVAYAPDGAYVEGPLYWGYGTTFQVILCEALQVALGKSFGLDAGEGFLKSAAYLRQMETPSGGCFNYSDCRPGSPFQAATLWFAGREQNPFLANFERLESWVSQPGWMADEEARFLPFALLWHRPANAAERALPLHWCGRGKNPVAVHRSGWGDPRAVFAGIKGGSPGSSHAHMDSGSFVLEADGVRWAVDLGMEEYQGVEQTGLQLWTSDQDGDRWRVFRLSTEAHNVLRFDGRPQRVDGTGQIAAHAARSFGSFTLLDLTSIYENEAAEVRRGLALLPDGRIVIQDEWSVRRSMEVEWQMMTTAVIRREGSRIVLEQSGRRLEIELAVVPQHTLEITDVSKPRAAFDSPNPGLKRIAIRCASVANRRETLRVIFHPENRETLGALPSSDLSAWTSGSSDA
jgi:hypothetical protein